MKNFNIYSCVFSLFALYFCVNSYAVPLINSKTGTVVDGSNITISGSGFGSKITATPHTWDNFNAGTDGVDITGKSPVIGNTWESIFASPVYSSSNKRNNTNNCKLELSSLGQTGRTLKQTGLLLSAGDKIFISFWHRFSWGTVEGSNQRQIKTWRILHYKSGYNTYFDASNWQYEPGVSDPRSWVHNLYDGAVGDVDPSDKDITPYMPGENWRRHDLELKISSAPLTNDGSVKYWVSEINFSGPIVKHVDDSSMTFIPANGEIWNELWLGQWIGNTLSSPYYTTIYYDDIYFDTSWQRVEIGNASTYESCTHREIQIPTAWTDTSITINMNQSSFEACGTYYLFVVDADGNVNAEGYPIKIVTGSGAAPCPPTGLEIQ